MDQKPEISQSPDVFHEAEGLVKKFSDAFDSIPQAKSAWDASITDENGERTFGFKKGKYFYKVIDFSEHGPSIDISREKDFEEGDSETAVEEINIDVWTLEQGDENAITFDDQHGERVAGRKAVVKTQEFLAELQS